MPITEQAHFRFGFFVACPLAPLLLVGAIFPTDLDAGLFWPTAMVFAGFSLILELELLTAVLSVLSLLAVGEVFFSVFFLSTEALTVVF